MAGIALNRFDIAAVQLQFISDTGMAKTVENDLRQIILFNELSKKSCDARLLRRHTQAIGHDKIEICVFTAQSFFREVLISFPFDQHLCYRLRKEDLSCTGTNAEKEEPAATPQAPSETEEPEQQEPPKAEKKSVPVLPIIGVFIILIACGGGYFMMQAKKKKAAEQRPDPDADYMDDVEEEYEIPEDDEVEIVDDDADFEVDPENSEE